MDRVNPYMGNISHLLVPAFPTVSRPNGLLRVDLGGGRRFAIEAEGASEDNKYVQSARLNGREWNKPWFSQDDLREGGRLEPRMGNRPNREWGSAPEDVPPSAGNPPEAAPGQPIR